MNAPQPCSLKLNLDHWVTKVTSVADPFFWPPETGLKTDIGGKSAAYFFGDFFYITISF